MKKLRLSYSLLKKWMEGDKEGAGRVYLRIPTGNQAWFERGIEFDKYVEDYVGMYKALPDELGGDLLHNPQPKRELQMGYGDKFILKGEVDVYDKGIIYEVKCTPWKDSVAYSHDFQVDFYLFIASLYPHGVDEINKTDRAIICRYDPERRIHDKSLIYRSHRRMKKVEEIIEIYGNEIYEYFDSQSLL